MDPHTLRLIEETYGLSDDTRRANKAPGNRAVTASDYDRAMASLRGKRSQAKGAAGEDVAERVLREAGIRMVERIATPFKIIARNGDWVKGVWEEKVSGDRRGILPGGCRVLCEVKSVDRNLRPSDFAAHQIAALTENAELGGLSLVVFVHEGEGAILQWPIDGFRPGRGISFERARELAWKGN